MSFEKYKKDVDRLVKTGGDLYYAMALKELPEQAKVLALTPEEVKKLPNFHSSYQIWYSEAVTCLSQLMPERTEDFISYYKPLKPRKEITYANYTISDYLKGLRVTRGYEEDKIVGPDAGVPGMLQQFNIVRAMQNRFDSSLFDIRTIVQADLFDNELDAADELNKKGFHRGSGALAGVVLEGHLKTVSAQHKIAAPKNSMLGKLNDLLKEKGVLDIPTWRFIQHLTDIRNLCDHKLAKEPSQQQIDELIAGVRKVTKTVF